MENRFVQSRVDWQPQVMTLALLWNFVCFGCSIFLVIRLIRLISTHCTIRECLWSYIFFYRCNTHIQRASLVAQTVKSPSAMQETWVRSPGWEDPLEKGMAAHSSILAWRIPWTEEPGGLQSMRSPRVRHNLATKPTNHIIFSKW